MFKQVMKTTHPYSLSQRISNRIVSTFRAALLPLYLGGGIGLLSLFISVFSSTAYAGVLIDVNDFQTQVDAGAIVIDIRSPIEVAEHGAITESRAIPFFDENGYSDGKVWFEQLRQQVQPEQALILVDQTGSSVLPICNMLKRKEGYEQVSALQGGFPTWQKQQEALQTTQPSEQLTTIEQTDTAHPTAITAPE
ncbi:MAG TPA: hypothetical protein ENK78_08990 [Thiothrix sp.]|nr:hypothetical protein [Thiothrix sp.]